MDTPICQPQLLLTEMILCTMEENGNQQKPGPLDTRPGA